MTLFQSDISQILETLTGGPQDRRSLVSWNTLPKFDYLSPTTMEEAARLLNANRGRAVAIAGGTNLLCLLKQRVNQSQPELLVNLKKIENPVVKSVTGGGATLRLGALVTLHAIESHPLVKRDYPLLALAARVSGVPQHRNMATTGGSICEQVRCWYYWAGSDYFHCLRKGGDTCYSLAGDNRYHAIFPRDCRGVCSSDIASALLAMDARVNTFSLSGGRTIGVEKFYTPLGNVLGIDEIITCIEADGPQPGTKVIFLKQGLRNPLDQALVSVAALVREEEGRCRFSRIVLGGVSSAPFRAMESENILRDKPLTPDRIENASRAAVAGARPLSGNGYKVDLATTLVKRAISSLARVSGP